jgi:hypothetical protein
VVGEGALQWLVATHLHVLHPDFVFGSPFLLNFALGGTGKVVDILEILDQVNM